MNFASATSCANEGVTIAIPNWNHEYFLPRSINSALAALQALQVHGIAGEVLVLDDASRDGSLMLLRQLEALLYEKGLRVWALKENGGTSATRNHGIKRARFRYIAFLDADNELVPANLIHFYRTLKQTGSAVAYGNLLCVNDEESRLLSNQSFQMRMFESNYIDTCAMYDRFALLDSGGYQTAPLFNGVEDWELFLHLAAAGKQIVYVPVAMGLYYDLPDSLVKDASARGKNIVKRMRRVFDQFSIRENMPHNTKHLRYHPDIGYF